MNIFVYSLVNKEGKQKQLLPFEFKDIVEARQSAVEHNLNEFQILKLNKDNTFSFLCEIIR